MPDFTTGGRRLAHAMMYGHLGHVMSCLAGYLRKVDQAGLNAVVEETWEELLAQASTSAPCRAPRARPARAGGHRSGLFYGAGSRGRTTRPFADHQIG